MRTVFADTSYLVALINRHDDLHEPATRMSKAVQPYFMVTSDFVLIEMLRNLARKGPTLRSAAHRLVDRLRQDPRCEVVPCTRELFDQALLIYATRADKDWDLVDCSSFVLMTQKGLTEALTSDGHFAQMGFRPLLREEQ